MNNELPPLESLPPSMYARARWARQTILENPELAEVDEDELLAWVYHEEDQRWYSISGNYSASSPQEKMEKRRNYEKKLLESQNKLSEKYLEQEKQIEYWSNIRRKILERDNFSCQLCGLNATTKLHVHHILKRRLNGTDHYDNLITVCPSCHKKADTILYSPSWTK